MSQNTVEAPRARGPLNGVDTPTLFATIGAVDNQRELAAFRFRAETRWQSGTHSRTSVKSFYGAGGEHEHVREFIVDADHPAVLVGGDNGPLPVELVLAGLASCLMGGIGNISAARGVELHEVTASVEGEMDIQGILGLSDQVRNGYDKIRVDFQIKGDAPEEKLRQIVEQSRARSAVFDVITNQVPVAITVNGA
ncbi:MAG TPA: OsmC family protein [Longimicrobiales bacterium]|nr:OsmC family protein [Longimicrobiales bacterium]